MNVKRKIFVLIALLTTLSCGEVSLPKEPERVKLLKNKALPKRPSTGKPTLKPKPAKPETTPKLEADPLLSVPVPELQPDAESAQGVQDLGQKYQKEIEVAEDEVEKLATIIENNKKNLPYAEEELRDAQSPELKAQIAKEIEYMQAQIGMTEHLLNATKRVLQAKEKVHIKMDHLILAHENVKKCADAHQEAVSKVASETKIAELTLAEEQLKAQLAHKMGLKEFASLKFKQSKLFAEMNQLKAAKWLANKKRALAKEKLDEAQLELTKAEAALNAAQVEVESFVLTVENIQKTMKELFGRLEQELDALIEKNKAGAKPAE